jgi:hypothetical protein
MLFGAEPVPPHTEAEEIGAAVNAVAVVDAAAPLFGESGSATAAPLFGDSTTAAVQAVAVVAAPLFGESGSTTSFAHKAGFLQAGNDMHTDLMTVSQACHWATVHGDCAGFTYAQPDAEPSAATQIYFKSVASFSPGSGWSTYIVTRPSPQTPVPSPAPTPSRITYEVPLPTKVQSLDAFCASKPVGEAGLFDDIMKEKGNAGAADEVAALFASATISPRQGKLFSGDDVEDPNENKIDDLMVGKILLQETMHKAAEATGGNTAPARTAADVEADQLLNDGLMGIAGDQLFSRFEDATVVRAPGMGGAPAEATEGFARFTAPRAPAIDSSPFNMTKPSASAAQASAGTLDLDAYIASQAAGGSGSSGGGLFD